MGNCYKIIVDFYYYIKNSFCILDDNNDNIKNFSLDLASEFNANNTNKVSIDIDEDTIDKKLDIIIQNFTPKNQDNDDDFVIINK